MLHSVYFYKGFFLERVLQVGSCRNYFPLVFLQISGKGALEKTTLKSLGLTGGSAVIRLGGAKFGFFILTFHSGGEFVLFQIPKKKKHEKGSKRQTLRHSVIIAFACLSETAAQMCFAQLQMLALTSHVQIKRACLLFFFILFCCVCVSETDNSKLKVSLRRRSSVTSFFPAVDFRH